MPNITKRGVDLLVSTLVYRECLVNPAVKRENWKPEGEMHWFFVVSLKVVGDFGSHERES